MIAESIFYCLRFRHSRSLDSLQRRYALHAWWIIWLSRAKKRPQEREYKRRIFKQKSQKSSQNQGFYGVFCKPHFHMIMISTLLFMTNDKPFVSKMKALFWKMCISPRRNAHFYGSKIAQDGPNMPSRRPKNALKRTKKAFLKPSWWSKSDLGGHSREGLIKLEKASSRGQGTREILEDVSRESTTLGNSDVNRRTRSDLGRSLATSRGGLHCNLPPPLFRFPFSTFEMMSMIMIMITITSDDVDDFSRL